jgi:hypothetical protein
MIKIITKIRYIYIRTWFFIFFSTLFFFTTSMSGSNTKKIDSDPDLQGQAISSQVGHGSASQEVPDTTEATQEGQTTPEEGQATTEESQDTTTEESQVATTQEGQDTTTEEGQVTTEESQVTTTQESQVAAITISTTGSTRPWNLIYSEPGKINIYHFFNRNML